MKNIFKYIIVLFMLNINLFSANNVIYSTDKYNYYNETLNKFISKEKEIFSYIENYIYNTGSYNITRNTLSEYYSLPTKTFTNLSNETCDISGDYCNNSETGMYFTIDMTNYLIILNNTYNLDKLSTNTINNYENSPYFSSDFIVSDNNLKILMKPKLIKFLSIIKEFNLHNCYISKSQPSDASVYTWIKPENNGIISIYLKDLDGNWFLATSLSKNTLDIDIKIKSTLNFDINLIILPDNAKITFYDSDKNTLSPYVSKDEKWYPIKTETTFDIWTGDSDLYDLACNIFDKPSSSLANISTTDSYIDDPQKFIKYDDFNNGYWNSDKYYVIDSQDTLYDLKFKTSKLDIAYVCSKDSLKYDTEINLYNNGYWYFIAKNFDKIFYFNTRDDEEKRVIAWDFINTRDDNLKLLFEGSGSNDEVIWKSTALYDSSNETLTDNTSYYLSNSTKSREIFTNLKYNVYYLTKYSDCNTQGNCNGSDKYTHSGWKIDDMYVWVYDGSNLIDAYPIDSTEKMYSGDESKKYAYLLTTNNKIYIKKSDINGNIVYQRKDNGDYITYNNTVIPDMYLYNGVPTFPTKVLTDSLTTNDEDIYAGNVSFDSSNIMILQDKIQMVNFRTNLNLNTEIKVSGTNGFYTFEGSYWENDNIKEMITSKTRNDFTYATSDDYTYLTLAIGCNDDDLIDLDKNCRYTDSGIKDTINTNFYIWYYANTEKSIKNLVDIKQLDTIKELYESGSEIAYVSETGYKYILKKDENDNICYQELNNIYDVITKNSELIPTQYLVIDSNSNELSTIYMPVNKTCSTISIYNNSYVFDDRTDLLDWTNVKLGLTAYLSINQYTYTATSNSSNTLYFYSNDANEYLSFTNEDVFDNVYFINNNIKYIVKTLGSTYLYNNGLLIGDYLTGDLKVNGTFSENDKNLYVFYANPLNLNNMNNLIDMFITDNIEYIYDKEMNYNVYYNSNYGYILLEKTTVNNSNCYVNKENSNSYKYVLKSSGKYSITGNNFPDSIGCDTAIFDDDSLVISDMKIAINWSNAENGYSVIKNDLTESNRFTLVNRNNYFYWINNTNLGVGTIGTYYNKIYAYNRNKIAEIPVNNLNIRAYTINIDNEETNTNLKNYSNEYYEWLSINNLDSSIRNYVREINNLTDYIDINKISGFIFTNYSEMSNYLSNYTEPTMEQKFINWHRTSNPLINTKVSNVTYYNFYENSNSLPNTSCSDDNPLNCWKILTVNGEQTFSNSANSTPVISVISNDYYKNYTFKTTLGSTANDDDYIGIIAAFDYDTKSFIGVLSNARYNTLDIQYVDILNKTNYIIKHFNNNGYNIYNNEKGTSGWKEGVTATIKVIKSNNTIKIYAMPVGETSYDYVYTIDLTLSDFQKFRNETGYGFYEMSQPYTYYVNVSFVPDNSIDDNYAYTINDNYYAVYDENTNIWSFYANSNALDTLIQSLNIGTIITNSLTNKSYVILYDINNLNKELISIN